MRPAVTVLLASFLMTACAQPTATTPPVVKAPPTVDAPPPPLNEPRETCKADAAKSLLGQPATQANAEQARKLANATSVRLLRFDAIVTAEYAYGRLNVIFDAGNRIEKITCG